MKKQSKFPLKDLLIVLGTLGFGFFCFLSINFKTLGNTSNSIIGAVIISCILGGLAYSLKLLKCTSRNFKTCYIWQWILIPLFLVAAFLAIFPFSHYFVINEQKETIQKQLVSNITKAEGLFSEYELYAENRLNLYENSLNAIVKGEGVNKEEYEKYGFNGTNDSAKVDSKVMDLQIKLYPTNYEDMKNDDSMWLSESKKNTENWSPTGIVKVVNSLEIKISTSYDQLKYYAEFLAEGEDTTTIDFPFSLTIDDLSSKLKQRANPTPTALIIGIGLYLTMLLSYFISSKHSKNPGCKVIFGKAKLNKNENEL